MAALSTGIFYLPKINNCFFGNSQNWGILLLYFKPALICPTPIRGAEFMRAFSKKGAIAPYPGSFNWVSCTSMKDGQNFSHSKLHNIYEKFPTKRS
ncbi:MAG: hypothetical protein R2830_06710 [Saprospiraceae bacterium]